MDIRRQLTSIRKETAEGITEYINRGSMIRYEMLLLGHDPQEIDLVASLLAGLPTEYATTVELLEVLEVMSLSGVTERLIAAEVTQKRLVRGTEMEAAAVAAATAAVGAQPPVQPHPEPHVV